MQVTQTSSHPLPGLIDYGMLIFLAAVWGGSFMLIKIAVESIPAASLTLGRLVVAALVMYCVARLAGESLPKDIRLWGFMALCGLFGNALPFTLISWGEETVDSGIAAILMAVMPLTTICVAHIFTKDEKLNLPKTLGVTFGIFGLIVLIGIEKLSQLGDQTIRQLVIACAAVCYGINVVMIKSLVHLPKRSMTAGIMICSVILMLPVSLIFEQPWTIMPDAVALISMVILGLVQTAFATIFMFMIIERQGASFFSQINFLIPVFGVIWGMIFLSEAIPASGFYGLGLILLGVVIARYRNGARLLKVNFK